MNIIRLNSRDIKKLKEYKIHSDIDNSEATLYLYKDKLLKLFNSNSEEIVKEAKHEVKQEAEDDDALSIITSPMVGTFYAKASPESDPFVSEGDVIQRGKVICIIEAMKLMNEIESEFTGTVVKCLVKNGDMVEYGQPLFKIREE